MTYSGRCVPVRPVAFTSALPSRSHLFHALYVLFHNSLSLVVPISFGSRYSMLTLIHQYCLHSMLGLLAEPEISLIWQIAALSLLQNC